MSRCVDKDKNSWKQAFEEHCTPRADVELVNNLAFLITVVFCGQGRIGRQAERQLQSSKAVRYAIIRPKYPSLTHFLIELKGPCNCYFPSV